MATVTSYRLICNKPYLPCTPKTPFPSPVASFRPRTGTQFKSCRASSSNRSDPEREHKQEMSQVPASSPVPEEEEEDSMGVKVALSMLIFYKREISPLIPKSCRYVPSCSEYSMQAYKRYGVVKGTILTAWRLCRCNPLGGSGFDPPRWFGEEAPPLD